MLIAVDIEDYKSINYLAVNAKQEVISVLPKFDAVKAVADQSDHRVKVGALIIQQKKIVAVSYNLSKSHPEQYALSRFCTTTHAEFSCIRRARKVSGYNPLKCDIVVLRVGRKNNIRPSYPCEICYEELQKEKIRSVYCYNVFLNPVRVWL